MEFVDRFSNTANNYSKKIKECKFTEGSCVLKKEVGYKDICELFFKNYSAEYQILPTNDDKENFIYQKKLDLAGLNDFDKSKYIPKFSKKLISSGLQELNSLSSILYLNLYFGCNLIICNHSTNRYYRTGFRVDNIMMCEYRNNSWFSKETTLQDVEFSDMNDLESILNVDINTIMIDKSSLKSIGNYKMDELKKMAGELNISLTGNGKNKLKKELYEEINLKNILNNTI